MRKIFLLLLFLPILQLLPAQHPQGNRMNGAASASVGRFYGKVTDESTGKGIGYATVQLFGMRFDSATQKRVRALVAGQLSLENGDFSLESIPLKGEYTLSINFLGFSRIERKVSFGRSNDVDLGNFGLSTSNEILDEVTVTGEASAVSLAIDKKVYKVDKDAVAAGGTAEDALKNIPTISVDIDGNVSMRNAAPQIFIDGRPTTLTVDQVPADAIDNIEIISNPSAKYDASGGGAGIVNIVLKKERRIGYNGSVRGGVDMRGRINFGADLNAREGKFNAFLGTGLFQRRSIGEGSTERLTLDTVPHTFSTQLSNSTGDRLFGRIRGGFDWFIDNRNTLTFAGNFHGGGFDNNEVLDITTDTLHESGKTSAFTQRITDSERTYRNYGGQILYKHLFPREGMEWTADANLNGSRNTGESVYTTKYFPAESREKQNNAGENKFLTFQTDFVNPVRANMKLEAGARAALRRYQSANENFEDTDGDSVFIQRIGVADNYSFDDQVYAGYTTFTHSVGKWGYQAGLRLESSFYTGKLLDSDSSFSNRYPASLFPSLAFTYKLDEEDNLQFSYSRRINRPGFFQLIPYADLTDPNLIQIGNPELAPEFSDILEFSYQNILNPKNNFLLSAYYRRTNNLMITYQYRDTVDFLGDARIISTYINANASSAYGLEFTLKNNFLKMFELSSNFNLYNSQVDAGNVETGLVTDQLTWFVKENLNVRFPKDITLQLSGQYQSRTAMAISSGGDRHGGWMGGPSSTAQGYSIPYWFVDVSLRKDLWKRKGSVSVNVQDIFRSRRNGAHSESGFFVQDNWRLRDPQLVRLNFSYRFGKFDASLFKRKNMNEGGQDGMDGGF